MSADLWFAQHALSPSHEALELNVEDAWALPLLLIHALAQLLQLTLLPPDRGGQAMALTS
jgi:hypothetical protein